ncbi:MAG: DUF167 domain-containing protein [Acidimicrobiales bacterium]
MVDEVFEMDGDERIVLRLHVQPGAGRTEVVGRHGDALKVRVAAAPERGRANEACSRLLAEVFGVKPSAVVLVGGEANRSKRFAVTGVDGDAVRGQLERAIAASGGKVADGRRPSRR